MEAGEVAPPDGKEFIQAQLFCLVEDDHVVWTTHNSTLREGPISSLMTKFTNRYAEDEDGSKFGLLARVDTEKLDNALSQGIAEIDLGLGAFKDTLEYMANDGRIAGGGVIEHLRSIFVDAPTPEEQQAASKIKARLSLKPGKSWSKRDVRDLLSSMASNVVEAYEDQFVIVTKGGVRLTREKMSIYKDYDVNGNKLVLNSAEVERNLNATLDDLVEDGLLED